MTLTEKLSTAPFRAAKKTERKVSKGKGKETDPGYFGNPLRSARACLRVKRPKPTCSYEFAGAAADEVAKTVWGTSPGWFRGQGASRADIAADRPERGEARRVHPTDVRAELSPSSQGTLPFLRGRALNKNFRGRQAHMDI